MAWYSIPAKKGSKDPYGARSLSDNWAPLVEWLREEHRREPQPKAYGVEHLPPQCARGWTTVGSTGRPCSRRSSVPSARSR